MFVLFENSQQAIRLQAFLCNHCPVNQVISTVMTSELIHLAEKAHEQRQALLTHISHFTCSKHTHTLWHLDVSRAKRLISMHTSRRTHWQEHTNLLMQYGCKICMLLSLQDRSEEQNATQQNRSAVSASQQSAHVSHSALVIWRLPVVSPVVSPLLKQ